MCHVPLAAQPRGADLVHAGALLGGVRPGPAPAGLAALLPLAADHLAAPLPWLPPGAGAGGPGGGEPAGRAGLQPARPGLLGPPPAPAPGPLLLLLLLAPGDAGHGAVLDPRPAAVRADCNMRHSHNTITAPAPPRPPDQRPVSHSWPHPRPRPPSHGRAAAGLVSASHCAPPHTTSRCCWPAPHCAEHCTRGGYRWQ